MNNCKCLHCGVTFHTKQSQINRGRGVFCSKKCQNTHKIKRKLLSCANCGDDFLVKLSDFNRGVRCCSVSCSAKKRTIRKPKIKIGVASGSRHWNWKGGLKEKHQRMRTSLKYKKFRTRIFERDKYACQQCGVAGGYLEVEHKKPIAIFPELIYTETNAVTLCRPCHKETPTFGYKLMHLINKYGKKKLKVLPLWECSGR